MTVCESSGPFSENPLCIPLSSLARHFSLKRESILRQCEAWVKDAPVHVAGAGNSTGMAGNRAEVDKVAKEIVALLGKMPAT